METDPAKRVEWDRNAALTTAGGLALISLPYTLAAGSTMYGTIANGLSNPITRAAVQRAGTKAALSTLAGEVIDRASYGTRDYIDNSSIGDTK